MTAQRASLTRNRVILERLGCINESGICLSSEKATHQLITLYNLEMMPLTLNQRKIAKIATRKIDLAKRWNADGLLSDAGIRPLSREKD